MMKPYEIYVKENSMDFFSILTLLGGLAMFLYGMQVMGDGLEKYQEENSSRSLKT